MKCKRLMSVLLSMIMTVGLLAGCGGSVASAADDTELQKAKVVGLLPEEWLSDMQKPVTIAEFNGLLTNIVKMRDPALVPEWENVAEQALQINDVAQRDDVILSIFEAAIVMGIDKARGNHTSDGWEGRVPDIDWWEGRSDDYDYFPNWNAIYDDGEGEDFNVQAHSAWYVEGHVSLVSEKYMIEPTDEWRFQFDLEVSREEAVRALVRFMECDYAITYGDKEYVPITEVGTYDSSIITEELLNKETDLPDVTQNELPSEWQGAGIAARKTRADEYLHFEESDIRVLAENGFNFTRLFFGFSTLRYPDFPADARIINEKELEELDQLLAWCMEYDVHLQIAMSFYLDENGDAKSAMPSNAEEWALAKDYWEALARRYAGIPSKYLSFDLCNEICPWEDEEVAFAKSGFTKLVNAIRTTDADRVLLHSFSGYSNEAWAEVLGSLKVAIGCHPYRPHTYCDGTYPESEFIESNLYWPRPRFNSMLLYGDELTITGEGVHGKLSIYPNHCDQDAILKVYADGNEVGRFDLPAEGTLNEYGGYDFHDNKVFSVNIPDGTEKITLMTAANGAALNAVGIENEDFHTWLMCHDAYESEDQGNTNLTIDADGVWQNADGLMSDAEYVYERHIVPLMKIAEKHDVGFMVNEFGLFGVKVYWDINEVVRYHDEFLKMLEAHDIGWCYCELANKFPKHLVILTGGESQWEGATEEEVTYTFDDGSSDTVVICKDLMDTFTKYTKR